MSSLKKIFLGLVACAATAAPFAVNAAETIPVTNAVIQESSTTDVSNVYWRGGWGRGWGGGFGYRGFWGGYGGYGGYGYGYPGYGYGYGYSYPSYGYGYGCCDSCC